MVANFSNVPQQNLNIGFPRGGLWHVLFNSGANVYDPSFVNGDRFDTTSGPGGKDKLNFKADVGVGAYSVVILSQSPELFVTRRVSEETRGNSSLTRRVMTAQCFRQDEHNFIPPKIL